MVKKLLLFFVLFIPLVTMAEPSVSYCNIGADPVDVHRKQYLERGEYAVALESDVFVTMRAGSGKEVSCVVRKGEEVVCNENGSPCWIKKCGNTILSGLWSPVPENVGLSDTDKLLLGRNVIPAHIAQVSECGVGTLCFARAQQFGARINIGAGVYGVWHHGLKADNYSLNNSQSQGQEQVANGGAGGNGGGGGAGGNGGPVNPPNGPPDGGGGPVNPPNGPVNPVN